MSDKKAYSFRDQPSSWFLNRGLFSDHFLKARLLQWKEWQTNGELTTFRKQLLSLYESTKPVLSFLNEPQTEKEFVQPLLDLLGYGNSYIVQAPTRIGEHTSRPDYALFPDQTMKNKAYEKLKNNDYTLCIGVADAKYWERELDLAKSSERDTFTNQNPSFQIASYLTGTKQTWGLLTNGRLWRLYCAKSHLPLGNYYQVDLIQLLEKAPEEALKYFYFFFRKTALIQVGGKSFLDRVLEDSNQYAIELETDIKERAYGVVEILCRGFAADFSSEQLTEQTLRTIYDNSLTFLYRLLFVFYAEARDLLPLTTNSSYRDKYSNYKLTQEIDETVAKSYQLSMKSTIYYQRINSLFKLIDEGDPDLGVPEYNGGLFNPKEHPFLEEHSIADAFLARAIHQLARIPDKKLGYEVVVDYNTLSERHLGSIYEGLLEFKPRIASSDLVTIKDKGSIKYAPVAKYPDKKAAYKKGELYLANDKGERKASGSYYTPEYIVNYIVENTLDPLIIEAHEKVRVLKPEIDKAIAKWEKLKGQKRSLEPTEKYDHKIVEEQERLLEPYLCLTVLDPAMGSGHFLARATDYLAEAIATDPDIKPPAKINEDSELTYYRRRVVESCIYGVDLNPLAVELAKLTLWLGTMAKYKPLSFLNHHLRIGNSLIGARVVDLDEIPKVKKNKGKAIDLSRAPVQLGLFQDAFNKQLYNLLQNRALIAQLPTETLEDVHNKEKWEQDFEHSMRRFRTLSDLWVSTYFGNSIAWDEYNTLVENLQCPEPQWAKLLQKESIKRVITMSEDRQFFHWELEFPEVFYDEKGNRKPNPGFDAVMGNPPWLGHGIAASDIAMPGLFLKGGEKIDAYLLFFDRIFELASTKRGCIGYITPNTYLTNKAALSFRKYVVNHRLIKEIIDLPKRTFPDAPDIYPAILVACYSDHKNPSYRLGRGSTSEIFQARRLIAYDLIAPTDYLLIASMSEANVWTVIKKIERNGLPLERFAQFRKGVETGDDSRFLTKEKGNKPNVFPWLHGREIFRYGIDSEGWYVIYGSHLKNPQSPLLRTVSKIVIQYIRKLTLYPRIIAALDSGDFFPSYGTVVSLVPSSMQSELYLLSLLDSNLLNFYYKHMFHDIAIKAQYLYKLPIKAINFITPDRERKQLLKKGKELYLEYLVNHDSGKVLAFMAECLLQEANGTPDMEQEKSDAVHDLLSYLAEEVIRLNKEKQSSVKGFLTWLEKEILKCSLEDQKNRTKINDFHNNTFEDLLEVLKKNKVVPEPCPSNVRDTIASEYSAAMKALTPLKDRIKSTDNLIDQIVYRLYGLTDAEIAIVEGRITTSTLTN